MPHAHATPVIRPTIAAIAMSLTSVVLAQSPPASPAQTAAAPTILDQFREEAQALRPLIKTPAANAFLDATKALPLPQTRTIWRNRAKGIALTQSQYDVLPADQRADFQKRDCDARFYYTTGYGSPLIYARPLDLLADRCHVASFANTKILDFGYGMIGQGRRLASLGAHVTNIDVEPMFQALYSDPSDSGEITNVDPKKPAGSLQILLGRWPADAAAVTAVGEGYDLVITKNVLKKGYIHPAREVDPRFLVNLGVDDATFLKELARIVKPAGHVMIYNISPAQNPADKPYLPHADGQCPFPREALESAGFKVLAFDENDTDAILDIWIALGLHQDKPKDEVRKDLFAWFTLLERK